MEKIPKAQLKRINKMLLEMASGNFFFRLERTGNQDNVEALMLILNMLAEEIQETLIQRGHPQTQGKVRYAIQMGFLLDHKGTIEMVNQHTCLALSYHLKDFLGSAFVGFLDTPSQKRWGELWLKLTSRDFFDTSIDLGFVSRSGLLVTAPAHITTFRDEHTGTGKILVSVIHYKMGLEDLHSEPKQRAVGSQGNKIEGGTRSKNVPKLSFDDVRKIREGRNLIMNNLERDLPSLKEFAHQLGTNEFKLKYGFRQLYGTSVFRFLLQERLRKSKMLIQHTDQPIKTIAYKTGFKSIPHFSRVFKKTYGYSPSALRKSLKQKE